MKNLLLVATLSLGAISAAEGTKIGVVDYSICMRDSKLGLNESEALEALAKQLHSFIDDTQKQMKEITDKFQDKDYVDGLSPEAEKDIKEKYMQLNNELQRYQQQYYQVLNNETNKVSQNVRNEINAAAEKIAVSKGLDLFVNKELCFYYAPTLEVTAEVIKEMDSAFDVAQKKQPPVEAAK
jgi:outer membrane protein